MSVYKLGDIINRDVLYQDLQKIAKYNHDNGDDGAVPYHISPADIYLYRQMVESGKISSLSLWQDGKVQIELKEIDIPELYRQLVLLDKQDDKTKKPDGWLNPSQCDKSVVLPRFSPGWTYWGPEWTPLDKLNIAIGDHKSYLEDLAKNADYGFEALKLVECGKQIKKDPDVNPLTKKEEVAGFVST